MAILTKFFDDLMNHITREYAGKKMKLYLNVSPLTIVNLLLWPFKVSSLYVTVSAYKWLEFMHNIITNSSDIFTNLQIFRANICYESLSTGKLRIKNSFEPTTICFLFQLLKLNKIREANWRKYLMNLIVEKRPKRSEICKNTNSRRFWKTP